MRGSGWDEYVAPGLWAGQRKRTFEGKRGQDFLARLENALVHWPTKKLAYEELAPTTWTDADGDSEEKAYTGDACAVGVLAIASGVQPDEIPGEDDGGMYDTCAVAERLGATWTMAWTVAQTNDLSPNETGEQRYERMLQWVRACRAAGGYVSAVAS